MPPLLRPDSEPSKSWLCGLEWRGNLLWCTEMKKRKKMEFDSIFFLFMFKSVRNPVFMHKIFYQANKILAITTTIHRTGKHKNN